VFFVFSLLAKFATWQSEAWMPHGHIEGLYVHLHGGKTCSFYKTKEIKWSFWFATGIYSESNLQLHFIILNLGFFFFFFWFMSVILNIIHFHMLYAGIEPQPEKALLTAA
jgi:hypothetical protein